MLPLNFVGCDAFRLKAQWRLAQNVASLNIARTTEFGCLVKRVHVLCLPAAIPRVLFFDQAQN